MRKTLQACCAALLAAVALAQAAQPAAASDPACPPPNPPGTPIAVTAPQALAQLFDLADERLLLGITPVVGDSAQGSARIQVTRTSVVGGLRVPGTVLAESMVALPAIPAPVAVKLSAPLDLAAGTYAIVVDPPGTESAVAWTRCGDESAGGARFRTAEPAWVPLPDTRLAFSVTGTTPDRTAPDTRITAAPPAYTAAATVEIAFTADEAATFTCTVDGVAAACTSPLQLAPAEGAHTVSVRATDAFGNSDPTPAVAAFVADRTAPELDLPETTTVFATNATGAGSVVYEAGAADALDPEPAVSCAPPSGSAFPLGQTTVTCQATDAAGNVATGSFLVIVRPDPGRAELNAQWNPGNGKIQVTEPGGGAIDFDNGFIVATRGAHVTRFGYRGDYEYKNGRLNTSLLLKSVAYDDQPAAALKQTFYSVCDATEHGDGSVKRAQITAAAGSRAVVVTYTSTSKQSQVLWVTGDKKRYETRSGLWVPRLRTNAGAATLELVKPSGSAPTGGAGVEASSLDAPALADALQRRVASDATVAALAARGD